MPSYLREPSSSVCWNCDHHADETVRVTVRTPTGGAAVFSLCGECYDAISPALAEVAGEAGAQIDRGATVLRIMR